MNLSIVYSKIFCIFTEQLILETMKRFYFKTICSDGITRTCEVFALKVNEAKQQATEIFGKFNPGHGFVNYMSQHDYFQFHNL